MHSTYETFKKLYFNESPTTVMDEFIRGSILASSRGWNIVDMWLNHQASQPSLNHAHVRQWLRVTGFKEHVPDVVRQVDLLVKEACSFNHIIQKGDTNRFWSPSDCLRQHTFKQVKSAMQWRYTSQVVKYHRPVGEIRFLQAYLKYAPIAL